MTNNDATSRIQEAFVREPALAGADLDVRERDGVWVLTGNVGSLRARRLAERTAERLAGGTELVSEIVVSPTGSDRKDDSEIRKMVKRVLEWSSDVPAEQIEISVEDGVVTLGGELDAEHERDAAEDAVVGLAGVCGFVDGLKVGRTVEAKQVEKKIRRALHRNADADAERIHVAVDGGKVTLRGVVQTAAEVQAAESAAWAVRGVTEVESHLRSDDELAAV